jgi:hypothetical protein
MLLLGLIIIVNWPIVISLSMASAEHWQKGTPERPGAIIAAAKTEGL